MKIKYLVIPEGYSGVSVKEVDAASFEHAAEEFAHWHDSLAEDKAQIENNHIVTVTDKHGVSKKIKVTGKTVRKYQSEVVSGQA